MWAQELRPAGWEDNRRRVQILPSRDSLRLDTLSIIPSSFGLADARGRVVKLDTVCFKIDHERAFFYHLSALPRDTLIASFRVYPFYWDKPILHRPLSQLGSFTTRQMNPVVIGDPEVERGFTFPGLTYNGSLARGISVGNSQDLTVNSTFNLQISGKLGSDIEILGSLTDTNIPFQAEGNTQQLQEFDRIFIQLRKDSTRLLMGDYELRPPSAYFMQYQRRLQGLSFSTAGSGGWRAGASAAVARGQYVRNTITGEEGNQGPYRLKGSNGELYIIILSGSERVYIDGERMERGYDLDYIIDYNLGEISFTNKRLITKDKRIIVEFEYSDKNYLRSTLAGTAGYQRRGFATTFYAFAEQDSRQQPLLQSLSDTDKQLLASVGDSVQLALRSGADSTGYFENRVLYRRTDTLIYNTYYPEIYLFSVSPEQALYTVSFSFVGEAKGHYILETSNINGRIYKWVAPDSITHKPTGSYEPVIPLIAPIKRQMLSWLNEYSWRPQARVYTELSLSRKDLNSFSSINNSDDVGIAARLGYKDEWKIGSARSWLLNTFNEWVWIGTRFKTIEPIRQIEFARDWNIADTAQPTERQASTSWQLAHGPILQLGAGLQYYERVAMSRAWQPHWKIEYHKSGWMLRTEGRYLLSKASARQSRFWRPSSLLQKTFLKTYTLGLKSALEQNRIRLTDSLALDTNSFYFYENEVFFHRSDTTRHWFRLRYKQRANFAPLSGAFTPADRASETGLSCGINTHGTHQLFLDATYRRLEVLPAGNPGFTDNNNFLTLIRHQINALRGALNMGNSYRANAGRERKSEYIYIPTVNNTGSYFWQDSNSDGLQQDEEFYPVNENTLTATSRYDRQLISTDQYINTTTAQFTHSLSLSPKAVWYDAHGLRHWLSYLSLEAHLDFTQNLLSDTLHRFPRLNPFFATKNDSLISNQSSLRTALFINRGSAHLSADFQYLLFGDRRQLISGIQGQDKNEYKAHLRYNFLGSFSAEIYGVYGQQKAFSAAWENNNFNISYRYHEPHLSWIKSNKLRLELYYRYKSSVFADTSLAPARDQKLTFELKKSILSRSSLQCKTSVSRVSYTWPSNPQLEFVVLEGLKPGSNFLWEVIYEKRFATNLQLLLSYNGRKSQASRFLHTAKAELRAVF